MPQPPPNMNRNRQESYPAGSTPVPDPTILTTQQLVREIAASREIVEAKYDTRLSAMDTATTLNKEATDKIPLIIDGKICSLKKLVDEQFATIDEKFASIAIQFKERDTRTEQTRSSDKVAVDAALQAAKEAVGEQNKSNALANDKTEQNFTKQLDQLQVLITTTNKASDEKINDLKGRLDRGEGKSGGEEKQKSANQWVIGLFVLALLQFIGFAVGIVAIFMRQ